MNRQIHHGDTEGTERAINRGDTETRRRRQDFLASFLKASPSAIMRGMKLQFSLACLLLYVTVIGSVAGLCARVPVDDWGDLEWLRLAPHVTDLNSLPFDSTWRPDPNTWHFKPVTPFVIPPPRSPHLNEIVLRLAIYCPLSSGLLAAAIYTSERIQKRRIAA